MKTLRLSMILLMLGSHSAWAGPLLAGFGSAHHIDPLFLGASGEKDANNASTNAAAVAYLPTLNYSDSRLTTDSASRKTITLSQPLINSVKLATLLGYGARDDLAESTYQSREQDLATRYFKVVGDAVRAEEGLRQNGAKIEALQQEFAAAKRLLEKGEGTISDTRDTELKLQQAQADNFTLEAQRSDALRKVEAISGGKLAPGELKLSYDVRRVATLDRDSTVESINSKNPQLISARSNQRLAELEALKAKGALLPSVDATYTSTEINHQITNYSGLSINFPLEAGTFFQISSANGNAVRQRYQTLDAEQQARLEGERLFDLVKTGESEMEIRLSAIHTAELSVEANEKSFRGGVRSKIDVLNSIQSLYQAKLDFVNTKLTYAENLLNLRLLAAKSPDQVMQELDGILF